MLAAGERPATVARVLGCSLPSVYNWATAWQVSGLAGLRECSRPGKPRRLDPAAEQVLTTLLETDSQSPGLSRHRLNRALAPD